MSKKRMRVLQKTFSTKDLFIINSYIEMTQNTFSGYPVCSEVLFLEFYKGYDRSTQASITFTTMELRRLMYACKELLQNKNVDFKSNYINYADPSLSSNTTNKGKKSLSIAKTNESYFINLDYQGKKYKITFDIYSMLAFCDTLKEISEHTDNILYFYQRKVEQKINKLKKESENI